MSLTALIEDIIDEAQNKDKKAKGGGILYNGKQEKKRERSKSRNIKAKATRFCDNCKNPKAIHKLEDCFVTNKKLWKE